MWRAKAIADRLNIGTKDEMEVTGYQPHKGKLALTILLTICTGGLLLILITWKSSIKLSLTHKRCPLQDAKKLLLKDIYHQLWEEEVVEEDIPDKEKSKYIRRIYFINKKIKYIWDETTCTYLRLRHLEQGDTFSGFHQRDSGLNGDAVQLKKTLYGENFMKIEILSIWQLLVQQAVNPFYIFQVFTVILWCVQEYYYFSGCILSLSVISITVMVWETRRQSKILRKRITTESKVTVLRDGERNITSSREVVPGDVLLLKDGVGMEADAVLLEGSVVSNEAMLTGESIPITKVAIPPESDSMFSEEEHKHHMLYSGTEVLQVRGGKELKALVVKTGFYTTRGELVRSILFPKPVDMFIYGDFMKMLFVFILLGLGAMSWSLYHFYHSGYSWDHILLNSLDLVTFVVPPILPATITAIHVSAQRRLRKHGIFCLSSNYISLAGSIDVVCFDKTGTLTEKDLALTGVVPCQKGELQSPHEDLTQLNPEMPLTTALATCHSLTTIDGKLVGYPLDVKMFNGIDWELIEPEPVVNQDYGMVTPVLVQPRMAEGVDDPEMYQLAILKTFPFKSKNQRMTVVTKKKSSNDYEVYIKGAPEIIASICDDKTVPGLMESALEWYTRQGLRVVAVAYVTLPSTFTWEQIESSPQEKLELGANFLGLVLLQNKVKMETPSVISTLHHADIQTVMITGDNLLTAVSVARQSGLLKAEQQLIVAKAQMVSTRAIAAQHLQVNYYDVDQIGGLHDKRKLISVRNDNYVLAADGHTFELICKGQDEDPYRRLIQRGKIFARMKPDQKILVVEALQDLGHQVAMCGDGCNDCGALKAANTGISLSSSEASVAAPFTSKLEDINSVPTLIREGRAALVSIFVAFKYDVCMCFGALICVIFQFMINTMPSDVQYLVMDLVLGTIPALVIGNTGASSTLVPKRPTQRILSILPALSMLSFLGIQILTYWAVMYYIKAQNWFEPFLNTGEIYPPKPNHENTALMLVNFHSFNIGVLVYSHAMPFRKHIYTNYMLFAYLICSTFLCLFMTFYTEDWMVNFLNFYNFPDINTPAMIFFIISISFLVSFIWEKWVLYGLMDNYLLPWIHKTCGPHAPYTKLERSLQKNQEWPPLSDPVQLDAPIAVIPGEPLKAKESLNAYEEEAEDETLLIRKLTKRHKFRASVKYVREGPQTPVIPSAPVDSTNAGSPTSPRQLSPDSYHYTSPDMSESYQVPWGTPKEKSVFSFNKSVSHQIMKGTGGVFSTFKGISKTRKTQEDLGTAEPYEVIHLQGHNESNGYDGGEEIYSTIPESPPSYTEDIDRGERGRSQNNSPMEQGNDVSIYEEVGHNTQKKTQYMDNQANTEVLYDVPQAPRPLDERTEIRNFPRNLMKTLSYIDDQQSEIES